MKHMLDRLAGKSADESDDNHAQAKMQVLHELRNMAMGMMGDKHSGEDSPHEMHEVSVAAPDSKGLAKGLDMAKHLASGGPIGPPPSLNAQKDSGYGEHLDSNLPNLKSNGSPMDDAAEEAEDQTEQGRSEPWGDEGEPDQHMLNPHRNAMSEDDDMYGDLNHDELDQHIKHLQSLKQKKMMKS